MIRLNIHGFIDNFLLIRLVTDILPNDLIVTISSTCLFVTGLEHVSAVFSPEGLGPRATYQLKHSVPYRVAISTNNIYLRLTMTPVNFINQSGRLCWIKTNYVMTFFCFKVSASDVVNAEKFFGPLAHITTSQLPQSRLASLLGETKYVRLWREYAFILLQCIAQTN